MSEEIRVYVITKKGKKSLYMRYKDPVTGKQIARSTGEPRRKEADRVAAKWEAELREGRYASPLKTTWAELIDKYSIEYLAGLSNGTNTKVESLFSVVEQFMSPGDLRLSQVDARWVSQFRSKLRKNGREETTIDGHCRHLKAMLRWGQSQGMVITVPHIDMSKRGKGQKLMKGRPVTAEEFERMLAKVLFVVAATDVNRRTKAILKCVRQGDPVARERLYAQINELSEQILATVVSWAFLLRGLWWSGLRLSEALALSWDEYADGLVVDTSEKYVTIVIPADQEKGGKNRVYPVSPEFSEMLLSVPSIDRTGFVFNPIPSRILKGNQRAGQDLCCRTIGRIGEVAGVVVDKKDDKTIFASAHDLRRSFGLRWSRRVMPPVLQELMRHESIETTMKFYVGQDAQSTAAELHRAFSDAKPAESLGSLLGDPVPR
jgi:integrase